MTECSPDPLAPPGADAEPEALVRWADRAPPGRAVLSVSFGGSGLAGPR